MLLREILSPQVFFLEGSGMSCAVARKELHLSFPKTRNTSDFLLLFPLFPPFFFFFRTSFQKGTKAVFSACVSQTAAHSVHHMLRTIKREGHSTKSESGRGARGGYLKIFQRRRVVGFAVCVCARSMCCVYMDAQRWLKRREMVFVYILWII